MTVPMMVLLRRPAERQLKAFLSSQAHLDLTYAEVGATQVRPPAGYDQDHTRISLGCGEEVFRRAKAALLRWEQFRLGWIQAWSPNPAIERGNLVAVVARQLGVWWLNASRIVYVVDEAGVFVRFGYAYGMLPDHAEVGEERFLVEWIRDLNEVCYDILAFSRPRHVLARLGYPYVRRVQKRFATESAAAMLNLISHAPRLA
jgi:uncharacterized protein (UPF0548 family)